LFFSGCFCCLIVRDLQGTVQKFRAKISDRRISVESLTDAGVRNQAFLLQPLRGPV
jgi:hypothetical protein